MSNVSNKYVPSFHKRLKLQQVLNELSNSKKFLSNQRSTVDFYILKKSTISYNNKSLQKSLYTQQENLSLLARDCNLPIFTANETISNLTR